MKMMVPSFRVRAIAIWKGKVPWHFVRVVLRLTHKKKNGGHNFRNAVSNLVFHPLEDLHRQVTGFHDD